MGGASQSWVVTVYLLDGQFPDAFAADEDPVPFDGEPHPEHLPMVMGPNPQDPNSEHEHNGAAPHLGVFVGNPHPIPPQLHNLGNDQQHQNAEVDI